jgi:hypothetical protein
MKKIIFISAILVSLLFSCKKDETDIPIGTIKVDINGVAYTFSEQAKATRLLVTGGYGIQIQGNYRTNSTTNLTLSIVRPTPISTGTYIENTGSNPLVTITHCTEVIVPCVIQAVTFGSISNPVSITITEITGSSVRGNFKGELQTSSGTTETLSNGVFYVSF